MQMGLCKSLVLCAALNRKDLLDLTIHTHTHIDSEIARINIGILTRDEAL